jgi:hypothetical protein
MMALLTSFRLCQKEKRKKGLGFPWRMFDLGCEIKRWEYIQQRHNAEHFRTSRKKPNTTQKKNSSLKWANIWGKVECRRRGSWEWRNQNRHTKLLKKNKNKTQIRGVIIILLFFDFAFISYIINIITYIFHSVSLSVYQ